MISTTTAKQKKQTTSVSIPSRLHKKAKKMGISLSQTLKTALENKLYGASAEEISKATAHVDKLLNSIKKPKRRGRNNKK